MSSMQSEQEKGRTYYAWSPIRTGKGSVVKVGESVNAKKLEVSDEDFEGLVESGAVRKRKYPVPESHHDTLSPSQFEVRRAYGTLDEVGLSNDEEE